MNSSSVMISGWLRKSPPEKKLRKNAWRKRWFVLRSGKLSGDPNLLEYYKHEGSKKPVGAICLNECSQIDANVPVKYERKDPSQQFVFDIVTKSRTYYLVAQSSHEMSFWVRYLCDLCGFNHDNPENQQDLGSQQQTFRANQPVPRPGLANGTSPLLGNEQESASDAPQPLPRPERTMTHRSVVVRNRGTNGQISNQDPPESTPTESNHPSASGTPGSLRREDSKHKNGYSYAAEAPVEQPSSFKSEPQVDSEYLYLTDCKTVPAEPKPPESSAFLSATSSNMGERRPSTDSVFTHEGTASDAGSDVIVDQPLHPAPLRFGGSSKRKQRLGSMPDCPPPPPPVKTHTERPLINMIDERGYTYSPDDANDKDIIVEARKRSVPTSGGLSPIDDTELSRVPLNLQRDFGLDDMGNRLPETSGSASSRAYNTSSGYGTEYINTADASAEARFGNFTPVQRQDAPQHLPIVGAPFVSPNSVFFNSPGPSEMGQRSQHYDSPSPVAPLYASPRAASPHNVSHHKGSLYSSSTTLSPFGPRDSPMRVTASQASPAHVPRMRRSSSVGQLENDLATAQVAQDSPLRIRRSSIDQRRSEYNSPAHAVLVHSPQIGDPVPMGQLVSDPRTAIPPPRPPKSDQTSQDRFRSFQSPEFSESSNYFNLSVCYTEGLPKNEPPPSPPHTEVIAVVQNGEATSSPLHTTIVSTFSVEDDKKREKEFSGGRSASSSSGGSQSGSSSSRSSAAAVYDVAASSLRDPPTVSLYDTQKKMAESSQMNDLYASPKPIQQTNAYDTPNSKPAQLADIDETRSDYEPMQDQLSPTGDEVLPYTCMVGATTLINSPPFIKKPPLSPSSGRSPAMSEPPPVKRDLKPKPGRASLGSDGGGSDSSKHLSRSSYDDGPHLELGSRSIEPPLSPPHAVLMHTMSSTSVVGSSSVDSFPSMRAPDRLQPPERPPKTPSQSGLSPRTPLSSAINVLVPERHPPYNFDRSRHPPDAMGLPLSKQKSGGQPYVPDRPPKPISMIHGASPGPIEPTFLSRHTREFARSQKSFSNSGGSVFPSNHPSGLFHPNTLSAVVPPPPMDASEKKLTYVELGQFDTPSGGASESAPSAEKAPKGDGGVEYWVLDPEKTEALQKMKEEREKEQLKRGSAETRSIKGGKT